MGKYGKSTVRGEQIADAVIERLRGAARYPQRDLQRLAHVWFKPSSCLRSEHDQAAPTLRGLETIVPYLHCERDETAAAAFEALQAGAVVCEHEAYASLPVSIWEVDSLAPAIETCFSQSVAQRLLAARFVSHRPTPRLEATLRAHLSDPIYTVRWLCVQALARLQKLDGLVDALVASAPRYLDLTAESWPPPNQSDKVGDFWEALWVIGPRANDVLRELRLQRA